jgi:hypothetical protein
LQNEILDMYETLLELQNEVKEIKEENEGL